MLTPPKQNQRVSCSTQLKGGLTLFEEQSELKYQFSGEELLLKLYEQKMSSSEQFFLGQLLKLMWQCNIPLSSVQLADIAGLQNRQVR